MTPSLKVLFIASEADPFIKIGGLGDVAGSLPPALKAVDPRIDIRLVIPFYGAIQRQAYHMETVAVFQVPIKNGSIRAEALYLNLDGLPVYLIAGAPITQGKSVYNNDAGADGTKFIFFSLAALELAKQLNWQPNIVHANDWHTAAAVYALALRRQSDTFFRNTRTLLSVHNLPYLGEGAGEALTQFGLPPARHSKLPIWAQDMPLPLGLLTADQIVAVSPTYAREILTPEFGSGLEDFLRTRADSITGILNGIDVKRWNPANDPHLVNNYDLSTIDERKANKAALQNEFDLEPLPKRPLLGVVSRLDYQKGLDLLPRALEKIRRFQWGLIVLGSGDPELEDTFYALAADYPSRVRLSLRYDAALSHRIFSAADALLIPSRYEPCGLTQMIAMRYGCLPIARATGGLVDTIRDQEGGKDNTGFLFTKPTSEDLASGMRRALRTYRKPSSWERMQINAMRQDFSWERSAQEYLALYRKLAFD
jgi:starch synthase